jgi:scyllo-inositol 2-dehydrogenase (NADP+)
VIGVGVVGYGLAGRVMHANLIRRVPELSIRAVVSGNPDRRAQAESDGVPRVHERFEALLEDDEVDLVVLATPHDTHAALTQRALAAGKHVVVDKPMAITLAEADAMVDAAARAGRMLSVFQNRRWDWDFLTVRKVIDEGLIGRPYLFETAVLSYREPRQSWRSDPATMGSLVHDWGAHLVDHALLLVGKPVERVSCRIVHARPQPAVGNYARIDLTFRDGPLYTIEVGNLSRPAKPRWYVLGDQGGILKHGLDPQERALRATGSIDDAYELPEERTRVTTNVAGQPGEIVMEAVRGTWVDYYRDVAAHLSTGAPLAVTAEQAREVIRVIDAAVRSDATGEPVRL